MRNCIFCMSLGMSSSILDCLHLSKWNCMSRFLLNMVFSKFELYPCLLHLWQHSHSKLIHILKQQLCIVLLAFFAFANGQEFPPISNYETADYNAESQNWDITQTVDKVMFFANNAGLLEFNGSRWNLYKNPKNPSPKSCKDLI